MAEAKQFKRICRWSGLVLFLAGAFLLLFQNTDLPELIPFFQPKIFRTVIIDAGHGGRDPGALGQGLREKDLTLELAKRLEGKLERAGFRTIMTREEDEYISLGDRVLSGGRFGRAIFLSLHFNKEVTGTVSGVETFFFDRNTRDGLINVSLQDGREISESENLAASIQASLVGRLQSTDRGIKNRGFYVLRHARYPAVLIEGGFLSHPMEAQMVSNGGYLDQMAEAIKDGVVAYRTALKKEDDKAG